MPAIPLPRTARMQAVARAIGAETGRDVKFLGAPGDPPPPSSVLLARLLNPGLKDKPVMHWGTGPNRTAAINLPPEFDAGNPSWYASRMGLEPDAPPELLGQAIGWHELRHLRQHADEVELDLIPPPQVDRWGSLPEDLQIPEGSPTKFAFDYTARPNEFDADLGGNLGARYEARPPDQPFLDRSLIEELALQSTLLGRNRLNRLTEIGLRGGGAPLREFMKELMNRRSQPRQAELPFEPR